MKSQVVIPFSNLDVNKYKTAIAKEAMEFEEERQSLSPTQATTSSTDSELIQKTSSTSEPQGTVFAIASQKSPRATLPVPTRTWSTATPGSSTVESATTWFLGMGYGKSSADEKAKEGEQIGAPLNIERMVQAYLDDQTVVYIDRNPLVYWYGKRSQWPLLTRLEIKYLASPVASVSSELVFSAAGAIVSLKRTSLSPKSMERLTMIKMNQHFIPPDYKIRESRQEEERDFDDKGSVLPGAELLLSETPDFEDELLFPDK